MSAAQPRSATTPQADAAAALTKRYREVRARTERLCAPLETEDYVVQSMPDASPAKWHLAHTTWFFETFVLAPNVHGFEPYNAAWGFILNSYYEAVGARHPRPERGLLTRPTVREVYEYRHTTDERVAAAIEDERIMMQPGFVDTVVLGLNHEEQHQELLLTDLQHALSRNPLRPAYRQGGVPSGQKNAGARSWIAHPAGLVEIGHDNDDFAFDNEGPRHRVYLPPFEIASDLVTVGEMIAFIEDGAYERPELWLSDGWAKVQEERWGAPLYWEKHNGEWSRYSLYGEIPLLPSFPAVHLSYYEADAFARWVNARLPTEAEWEVVARSRANGGPFLEDDVLLPTSSADKGFLGGAWVWTASPYSPYPGYSVPPGALGEYNGKFMCNQLVLRGGSCFTPRAHVRVTYRNFFPPHARWQVTGIRLAR